MNPLLPVLLAGALPAPPGFRAAAPASAGELRVDERLSLEELLRRAREAAREQRALLQERVAVLLQKLRTDRDSRASVEATRRELAALGRGAAPLLASAIDPGSEADPLAHAVADDVVAILLEVGVAPATEELVAVLRSGSIGGRRNALTLLETHPQPARVFPALRELYESSEESLRRRALQAIATLGGAEANELFEAALEDASPDVVDIALEALADAGNAEVAGEVLALVQGAHGPEHVATALRYYQAVPEALQAPHVLALVELARGTSLSSGRRVLVLETLARFDLALDRTASKAIESIAQDGDARVAEAALVLLSVLGDKGARRDLLAPYDEQIRANKKWAQAYLRRADALYRIRDYKKAVLDYRKAHGLQVDDNEIDHEPYIGLARCYALMGDFKDASEWLGKAPVSLATLRELVSDPDFAEMARDPKHKSVFEGR